MKDTEELHDKLNGEGSRNYEEVAEIAKQLKGNADVITEKNLDNRLAEAVNHFKNKNFDLAEDIFSDLMVNAVKFFKSETHNKMSKFFF